MTAATGLMLSLFALLVLGWPSERARQLTEFARTDLGTAAAALFGWIASSIALAALPLAAAFGIMNVSPGLIILWRWGGLAVLFWLATAGALAPSLAYRPMAANDNLPVRGALRIAVESAFRGYDWKTALLVAAVVPQFIDPDRAIMPQFLIAGAVFTGVTLLSAVFFGLFPARAHAFLNLLPARRKALKTSMGALHQHGQTRISYRRKAA
ncbi:hypothetical protein [Gellertiella hungarica]|uniref:Threonine/homoserine/homoserine lactone efflux protein n=1 Tax=Gellertiella hungarica TaxID=1572859 RepID=A0A7W6NJI9_9HYPH|nr:hypothetical protein [Gellertiella hungarica]MBB4063534.1 threonine/homoserine/homoserine lactone efflux protein [Gellertiella hungarica]